MNPPVTHSSNNKLLVVLVTLGLALAGGLWWFINSATSDHAAAAKTNEEGNSKSEREAEVNPDASDIYSEENDTLDAETEKSTEKNAGSVVSGKAINTPQPSYSQEARAAGAKGKVNVEVLIDGKGNVISAKAVSGHALLHKAAEAAALKATFHPTRLGGKPVQVSGTIVYNFN